MELHSVTVAGFRRFRERSLLRTNGKLVALVGPNEAGKSSLLHAISLLSHDKPPPLSDSTRGESQDLLVVEGRYHLSPEDREVAGAPGAIWLRVTKRANGTRDLSLEPVPPSRDFTPRRKLAEAVEAALRNSKVVSRFDDEEDLDDRLVEALELLESTSQDLSAKEIGSAETAIKELVSYISEKDSVKLRNLPTLLALFVETEAAPNPNLSALNILRSRLPVVLFFGEDDRDLASDYDLAELGSHVPAALRNLCQIAELNISQLVKAYEDDRKADVATLETQANDRLKERFKEDWQQSGVSVSLKVHNNQLIVLVENRKREFTSFAERSDGLRQFVALQAFATGKRKDAPILLIDEAEQKLHYDAQADLIQMLARQQLASKVIYTTHSAGCLPEDLGNGVRFARPHRNDETRSEIANNFWSENEPGFAPLLFGMGASTLAFFPTRHAVMVEGASDMLLLPTMLREALGKSVLGFQLVPGLSNSDDEGMIHAPAIGKDNSILYLVDGDDGGVKLKNRLMRRKVTKENIFVLSNPSGTANEVEDFLDIGLLVAAANNLLQKYYPSAPALSKKDLPAQSRMSALEKAFRARAKIPRGKPWPGKVALSYEVLDLCAEDPSRRILAADRRPALRAIGLEILARFKAIAKANATS